MSLTHQTARQYLELAADGLLRAEQAKSLQQHLEHCAECRDYAERLSVLENLLRQSLVNRWPVPKPADPVVRRGLEAVQNHTGTRYRMRRLFDSAQAVAGVGLIVVFVVGVYWLFRSMNPQMAALPEASAPPAPSATAATAPTPVPVLAPTPTPVSSQKDQRTLDICIGVEPDTLYLYGQTMLATDHIHEAIYDGPIDSRGFSHQAVILEKLPSLADDDAVTETVTVEAGDLVIDDAGRVVTLEGGTMVRPAGCANSACAITFDDGPVAMEQMVVTFTLRPEIRWSDGTALTAFDSVYSFELDRDPDTPSDKRLVDRTASYKALDQTTTVWVGLPGYRDSRYYANFWTPLPEHAWGALSALELTEARESSRAPLGWGPFVIEEWAPGEYIELSKNPFYWRADEGLPHFDRVVYHFTGDQVNTSIAALLAGDCDIVDETAGLENQTEMLLELQAVGKINATLVTGNVWEHLDFGIKPTESYDRPDFFGDVRVRRAIAHCLDRQAAVDTALYGQSHVLDTYVSPDHPLYNPDVATYPFDPQVGSALLEEVGWIDDGDPGTPRVAAGIDGIPDGTPLTISLWSTTANQRQAVTQILRASLAECGIRVELEYWGPDEFFANGPDGPVFGRHFDLVQFAWLTGVEPPCELYTSDNIPSDAEDDGSCGWACANATGFSNTSYDDACRAALQSLPGSSDYKTYHQEAQRIFAEQLPAVPLYLRIKLAATRPEIKNFMMDPTASSGFWNIEAFDLD